MLLNLITGQFLPQDSYKVALLRMRPTSDLFDPQTEVKGYGYSARLMPDAEFYSQDERACITFSGEMVWKNATISPVCAVIFNVRNSKILHVEDLTGLSAVNGDFKLMFPGREAPLISVT